MLQSLQEKVNQLVSKINAIKGLYFILAFVVLNLVLKLVFISSKDISHDEPFTIFHAQATWDELWLMLKTEPNPPLFFILLHFWVKLFGVSPLSVRFLPVLFSTLTVISLFKLSKLFGKNVLAIATTLLFTFSNAHLACAHDTRQYSLFALFTLLSSYQLFKILFKGDNKRSDFIFLAGSYFLMLYSHHIGFIVGFIHLIVILLNSKKLNKQLIVGLLGAGVGTLLLYAHYIPIFYQSFFATTSSGTLNSPPILMDLYGMIRYYMNEPVIAVFSLIAFGFFLVKFVTKKYLPKVTSLLLLFLGLYFTMFFLSDLVPLFISRYVLFISLFFYLLVVLGIKYATNNNLIRTLALFTILIAMVVSLDLKTDNNRYVKTIVGIIKEKETKNTAIIMCPVWTNHRFAYYYDQATFKDYSNFNKRLIDQNVFSINSEKELNNLDLTKFDKIIYLDGWAETVDPELLIQKSLETTYTKSYENYDFEGYRIFSFDK